MEKRLNRTERWIKTLSIGIDRWNFEYVKQIHDMSVKKDLQGDNPEAILHLLHIQILYRHIVLAGRITCF